MGKPEYMRFVPPTESPPPEGEVLIVESHGKREQCEIKDGIAYEWRWRNGGRTENAFCSVSEITGWRGCTGFDF
jgi:hypothetical protein